MKQMRTNIFIYHQQLKKSGVTPIALGKKTSC